MVDNSNYVHTGCCIWCKRSSPEVSFSNAPHIVPKGLGGTEIGIDVCDECNHFFGTAGKGSPLNTNLVFKEVFNASLYSLSDGDKMPRKYSSTYFHYDRNAGIIKLKRNFPIYSFTKQFKRSLYEVFLQKYHKAFPDDPLDKFEGVRQYARYGIGELNVYFAYSKLVFVADELKGKITISMNETLKEEIDKYGYFTLYFCGHILILEVLPFTAANYGKEWLLNVERKLVVPVDQECGLYELNDIRSFDMFYNRLSEKYFITDHRIRR